MRVVCDTNMREVARNWRLSVKDRASSVREDVETNNIR